MTDLPSGTVTLLFSDIEGSTALLSKLGDRYGDVLSTQRRILRSAFAQFHGRELGTEGDSFFVAFRTAGEAVQAARTAQRDLAAEQWPDNASVRVRMSLHTGEPTLHEDGYVGMDVHRAARMAASAHGGQVVVSAATQRIVGSAPPDGVGFVDLGMHRLKDIPDTEHLYQLTADGLGSEFPSIRSLGSASTLPVAPTTIVGRDGELAEVADLLRRADVRLVTLTGPGGSGKTRLAVAVAARLEPHLPDGVYFVSLGDVSTVDVMWSAIAEALGATGAQRVRQTVLTALATRRCLLVLDNLEQLEQAPRVVVQLLAAGLGVRLLATSRRLLRVGGEYEHPVPPLELPPSTGADLAAANDSGAVTLFVDRAAMVRPGFELTGQNVADVVDICRRVDGLPLALELAAAGLKLMSPAALRVRLGTALALTSRVIERPARQQTLRSTIEWSYSLLTPELQRAFRHLGVFAGPFDLAAAEAVVAGDDAVETTDPLAVIGDLVDASLVRLAEETDSEPRFLVLQTIGAFAREKLADHVELDDTGRRHAVHYLAVVDALPTKRGGPTDRLARKRIETELGNLRAALAWALGDPTQPASPSRSPIGDDRAQIGLHLCRALAWFWYVCGYQPEGRRWLTRAVELAGEDRSDELMGSLHMLGVLLQQHGEWEPSRTALELCLDYWRTRENPSCIARELNSLGCGYRSAGDADVARDLFEQSIRFARSSGEESRVATALTNLAILEVDESRPGVAIDLLNEALEIDLRSDDAWAVVLDQCNLAAAMMQAGRSAEAWQLLHEHASEVLELGDIELTITVIELFSQSLAELGDAVSAARLLGASEALRVSADLPIQVPDAAILAISIDKVRDMPDPSTWAANTATGRAYTADQAIAEAVAAR